MQRAIPLLTILLLASPCAAQSEDPTAPAREVFSEAARQFEAHNYALALRGFNDAYDQLRALGYERAAYTLYNVGRCYEELGRLPEARDAFQRFIDETGEDAPHRAEVQDRIRDLQARIDLAGGDRSAPSAGGGENLSWVGWATVGVGGAAILASVITGALALDAGGQLAARCPDFTCGAADASLIDQADSLSIATDVLLFAGIGVAAVGVLLAILLDHDDSAPAASAFCTPDGCAMSIAQSF